MKRRVPFGSSLRARVMIGVLVPLVVVLGLAAYIQFAGHRELMLQNLEEISLSVGDGVEASLARAMLSRNTAELAAVAQDLGSRPSIRNLMILDMQGTVKFASRPSDVGNHLSLSDPTCQVCHRSAGSDAGASIVLSLADGSRVFRNITPVRNGPQCQGCHPASAKLNGILLIDLPYDSVEARLWADLRQNVLLALGAIILVAVSINLLLSRIVVAKLESFGDALMRFAKGDFGARVPISGDDEIGHLAGTVNAMAEGLGEKAELEKQIERSAQELELKSSRLGALYRVALESSRSLEVDRVMNVGLENALAVTGMDSGEIHLVRSPGADLLLRATARTSPEFAQEEESIGWGECFCGAVAARGETCAIGDLTDDQVITRSACRRRGDRAVAAVPLQARGRTLGVLTLHGASARQVSADDSDLLSALGDQLGIAIDNALLYTEMESRVQELTRQVQHLAVLEERVRLGREMHDGFAQAISLLNLKLRMAQSSSDGQLVTTLKEMGEIVDAAYDDVRQAIGDLRMPLTPEAGIVSTVRDYAQSFAFRYDLQAQISVPPEAEDACCSADVMIQVIRIVQEALANVRKHAHAKHLLVAFERSGQTLDIRIRDDGAGFGSRSGASDPGHFGISIMRERASTFGGQVRVDSANDIGTTVTVTVPIEGA